MDALEDPIGKVIVKSDIVHNEGQVKQFTIKDYSLYGSDGKYFAVDKKGIITLKTSIPLHYYPHENLYNFQLSMFYTVILLNNTKTSGFFISSVKVKAIGMTIYDIYPTLILKCFSFLLGPVKFDNTTYRITVPLSVQVYDVVYNFMKHIMFNESAFKSVNIKFGVTSSYFSINASSGDLYMRRALRPATFSFKVNIQYDVTLKNGAVFSSYEDKSARVVVVGKIMVYIPESCVYIVLLLWHM